MSKLNDDLQKRNCLSFFEIHLQQIKPHTTKEEILAKMRNKQCIFSGLLRYFKGDTIFREMRKYFEQHLHDRELVRSMRSIIEQTFGEVN